MPTYLDGYAAGAAWIRGFKMDLGWVRLCLMMDVRNPPTNDEQRGFTDALLDSVGC